MASYLTLDELKTYAVVPRAWVDLVEQSDPGFLEAQLEQWSRWIDARLRKRYKTPFDPATASPTVKGWLARIVSLRVLWRRGIEATDQSYIDIKADAEAAIADVLEAANGEVGLFDLPEADGVAGASGIVHGMPRVYSETSPYVAGDEQERVGRGEDNGRFGTFR